MKGVVVRQGRLVVGEAVEVPVRVAAQHDRGLLLRGYSAEGNVPVPAAKSIGDVGDDLAGEALFAVWIGDGEGDAAVGVRDDGEVAPAPTIWSTVESV